MKLFKGKTKEEAKAILDEMNKRHSRLKQIERKKEKKEYKSLERALGMNESLPDPDIAISIASWAKKVKRRDGYCKICGTDEELEAHHMLSQSNRNNKDLSQNRRVSNGITLCYEHHKELHKELGLTVTKEQTLSFIQYHRDGSISKEDLKYYT